MGVRANTGGEPCGDTKGIQVCLGCFKRADVYVHFCKVMLCDSSGEYLEFGYNKNIDKLKTLLLQLKENKCEIDIVMLCETFITDLNVNKVHIDGYELHEKHRLSSSRGWGLPYT